MERGFREEQRLSLLDFLDPGELLGLVVFPFPVSFPSAICDTLDSDTTEVLELAVLLNSVFAGLGSCASELMWLTSEEVINVGSEELECVAAKGFRVGTDC